MQPHVLYVNTITYLNIKQDDKHTISANVMCILVLDIDLHLILFFYINAVRDLSNQ